MVRFAVVVLALILALPVVCAIPSGEVLYSEWIYPGDTFERDGIIYYVEEGNTLDKILIYVDDSPYIMRNHYCKPNEAIHEKYCLNKSAYEDIELYEDNIRYEHGEEIFGYYLEIRTLVPDLTATRLIKPDSPVLDKRSIITVTLENKGEKVIEYITYLENITSPLQLEPIDGFAKDGQYTYELDRLGPGRTHTFQYAVRPSDYVTATIKPLLSYAYQNVKKSFDVSAMTITVAQPLAITRSLSTTSASINEEVFYTLTLQNEEPTDMDLSVEITIPKGVVLEEIGDDLTKESGKLIFDDKLEAKKVLKISFSFSASVSGDYPFTVDIDAHVNDKDVSRFYSEKVSVITQQLVPTILFSRQNNILRAGESASIRVFLNNSDKINNFVNVIGEISSELLEEPIIIDEESIARGEGRLVAEFPVVGPQITAAKSTTINFDGSYATNDGEEYNFTKTLTFSLEPMNDYFDITQEINVTNATLGETIHIVVIAKNKQDTYLFANIYDTFSDPVTVVAGTTFAELSFEGEQQRDVYIYEIQIPDDFPEDVLIISTKVYEQDESFPQVVDKVIPVYRPEVIDGGSVNGTDGVDGNGTGAGSDDGSGDGSGLVEKEPGFFTKAWNWIKSLF